MKHILIVFINNLKALNAQKDFDKRYKLFSQLAYYLKKKKNIKFMF